ncbi:MAG TPA: G-D-S-L family lipolytic protein [Cyanobacteria bacterium UBA8803]|nr:G-D-S-L family lipolytic protein [Cyanobacteria bacterium UBA9273]HBL59186.1 G-D-S-L family lipolytic protein [Cyanobacteria bacterium UBA8803]
MLKLALPLSILINFLLVAAWLFLINKKGGIPFLLRKLNEWRTDKSVANSSNGNPYHQDKKSHFDTLPSSATEILFLGDSLTDYCEWQEFFRNLQIKNRGIAGDTTYGVLNRLQQSISSKPQKLFLMIGINDITKGTKVTQIAANYRQILEIIKNQSPNTTVFIQSVLPVNSTKFPNQGWNQKVVNLNTHLNNLAEEFSFDYIDLFPSFLDSHKELNIQYTTDGVHLNGQGYLLWTSIIEKNVLN